jgi:mono/diheme cytochrome c family protein
VLASCGGSRHSEQLYTTIDTGKSYNADLSQGMAIFRSRCETCHGIEGNALTTNAANLQVSVLDSLSIAQTVRNGRGRMPGFFSALPDSAIGHLCQYVFSLRKKTL